jgi:hypothetical protein
MFIDSNQDTFEEWEWVNPPMIPNTEYKTTERWNKKPVYTALIDCGTCPSASIKTVAHGKSVGRILKVHASLSASGITAPYFNADNYSSANNYLDVTATATNVLVKSTTTGWASSGYTVTAQIWYVNREITDDEFVYIMTKSCKEYDLLCKDSTLFSHPLTWAVGYIVPERYRGEST